MTITDTQPGRRWIEYLPVDQLAPHPANPKGHALDALVAAVERWGYTEPILYDERTGLIASGHGRREALTQRRDTGDPPPDGIVQADDGTWMAPVVRGWSSANDSELRAYLFAANNLVPAGGWVGDYLAPILQEMADTPDGLSGTALTPESLEALLAEISTPDFQPGDPADQPRLDRKFHLVCNQCGASVDPATAEKVDE